MNKDIIIDIIICVTLISLLIIYSIYVIIDERKKIKYYNKIICYNTNWDKYQTMLKEQNKIIINKKIELYRLKILVMIRRIFK